MGSLDLTDILEAGGATRNQLNRLGNLKPAGLPQAVSTPIHDALSTLVYAAYYGIAPTRTASQNDAGFADVREDVATRARPVTLVMPDGTIDVGTSIDFTSTIPANRDRAVSMVSMGGRAATVIRCVEDNIPIIRWRSRYGKLVGLTLAYADLQAEDATAANCLQLEGQTLFSYFRELLLQNGYASMGIANPVDGDTRTSQHFSCTLEDIRSENAYMGINMPCEVGSGSVFRNIYCSAQGRKRAYQLFNIGGILEGVIDQLNLEQSTLIGPALTLGSTHNLHIRALHMEGVRLYDGAGSRAFISTSAQGRVTIDELVMDDIHVGGHVVTGITRSGTTATATLTGMGQLTFTTSGHPYDVGDTVTISGADQSEYNGVHTVTAVTATTLSFEVAGAPASPATWAAADYIAIVGGSTSLPAFALVTANGSANSLKINTLHRRDMHVIGSAARSATLRWCRPSDTSLDVDIDFISDVGQYTGTVWDRDNAIIATERTENVAKYYFEREHGLKIGSQIRATGTIDSSFGGTVTVGTIDGPYSITATKAGSDQALTKETGALASVKALTSVSRARANGIATLVFSTPHGLKAGQRIRVLASAVNFSDTETAIQTVPDEYTLTYKNSGSDDPGTLDAGIAITAIESAFSTTVFSDPSSGRNAVRRLGHFYRWQCAVSGATIAAGAYVDVASTVYGARVGDMVRISPSALLPAGLTAQAVVTAPDTVTVRVTNVTSGGVAMTATLFRGELLR